MTVGQKVICVNDKFPTWVHKLYTQLPVKDTTYTIRAVAVGRAKLVVLDKKGEVVKNGASDATGGEVQLLLQELVNPPDPYCPRRELGFSSERFAPQEEAVEAFELAHAEEHALGT